MDSNQFLDILRDGSRTNEEVMLAAFRTKDLSKVFQAVTPDFTNTTVKLPSVANDAYTAFFSRTPTFAANLPTIHENVGLAGLVLPKLRQDSYAQAFTCQLENLGTNQTALSEVKITPCQYAFYDLLCKTDFSSLFNQIGAWRAQPGTIQTQVLPIIFDNYLRLVRTRMERLLEDAFWNGDVLVAPTATNYHITACDGILKKADADATVNNIPFAGPITNANIIAALTLVYEGLATELLDMQYMGSAEEMPFIVMNSAHIKTLTSVYGQTSGFYNNPGNAEKDGLMPNPDQRAWSRFSFLGIPIYFSPTFPVNHIIALNQRNLHMSTNLLSDMENIRVADKSIADAGDNRLSFALAVTMGNAYTYGDYITYLHP